MEEAEEAVIELARANWLDKAAWDKVVKKTTGRTWEKTMNRMVKKP